MKYSFRPSTEADFEFVFQLNETNTRKYVEVLRGWDDKAERAEMRRQFQPGADQIIMIDGNDADVLGVNHYPTKIDLRHIEILPEYQGRGITTATVREIVEEVRQANIPVTLMVLNMNSAKELYEGLGFRVLEEVDTGRTGVKYRMTTAAP